jgi:hypothetical protein
MSTISGNKHYLLYDDTDQNKKPKIDNTPTNIQNDVSPNKTPIHRRLPKKHGFVRATLMGKRKPVQDIYKYQCTSEQTKYAYEKISAINKAKNNTSGLYNPEITNFETNDRNKVTVFVFSDGNIILQSCRNKNDADEILGKIFDGEIIQTKLVCMVNAGGRTIITY